MQLKIFLFSLLKSYILNIAMNFGPLLHSRKIHCIKINDYNAELMSNQTLFQEFMGYTFKENEMYYHAVFKCMKCFSCTHSK